MSANRLFLVCTHHESLEDALLLADRGGNDAQYLAASMKRADDWYARHMRCGRGCDHFKLAYHRTPDWDVAPPAENTVPGAVRLNLALNGSH